MTALASRLTDAAAGAAEAAFDAVARVRHRKPLHPRGVVVRARVERTGTTAPLGAAWLDETATVEGVARFSRSAGLPDGWPDVWGLAMRLDLADGSGGVADLLLSTAWAGPIGRHALALRRGPRAPFSAVLPYRTSSGLSVLLGALGDATSRPSERAALAAALTREPLCLTLAVASGSGPWRPYGTVVLGGSALGSGDGLDDTGEDVEVSFDPVLHPLPGLRLPEPLAAIRARAYAGARRGRHADPAALGAHAGEVASAAAGRGLPR